MVGKWHLGINAVNRTDGSHLPSKHGFDFVGKNLPLSVLWDCDETGVFRSGGPDETKCFLYDGDVIYQQPIKFETLTSSFVDGFVDFLDKGHDDEKPFFFYFSFPHVHTSLWAADRFVGTSKRGLFGDNMNEMQWATKQVIETLKSRGLERNTLVIFLSDHGPHKEACKFGGSTAGLKGGKSNSFEGGFRIPAAAWWPGTIAPNQVANEVFWSLDIFPTLVRLAGGQMLADRAFDGVSIDKLLTGHDSVVKFMTETEKRPVFFYCNRHLMAVRLGAYKVHYITSKIFDSAHTENWCRDGIPAKDWYVSQTCLDKDLINEDPPLVYDLETDPYELYPLNPMHEKLVSVLEMVNKIVKEHKERLTAVPDQMGKFTPKVLPCCDYPKCTCNYEP